MSKTNGSNQPQSEAISAAIYCRISRDAAGAGLGVERQEADCRALAKKLGWKVVGVFIDNDISAYSGAPRPQYRAMLDAVKAGQVGGIVAWHTDRLHRRATELEEFVTIAEKHALQVQTVTAGHVDLTTASGRMVARMLGAAAQHEVDHARERMRRAKEQMALDGKYRGGPRPYGYEKDGTTFREDEAEALREAVKEVLAGRSMMSIAREMNERGLRTSTGKEWTYARLKDVITRPRNAGLLSKGRADRGTLEVIGTAQWPGILDEDTYRAVYALVQDKGRRLQTTTEKRWLGSGLYVCGLCGEPLRVTALGGTAHRKYARKYHYRCQATAHLTVRQDETDQVVKDFVADLLRDPRIVAGMQPKDVRSSADRDRRTVLVSRLEGFEADYAAGAITGAQLAKATATVNAELAEVEERIALAVRQAVASPVVAAIDPGQAFLDAPLDIQRAVLRTLVSVTILKSPNGGGKWRPERVQITVRSDEATTA